MAASSKVSNQVIAESVFVNLLFACQETIRRFEHDSGISHARVRVLAAFRDGRSLNQNQIAKELVMDRAMVHRMVKSLVREKLIHEKKAKTGRSIPLTLTPRGEELRHKAIETRKYIDRVITISLENPRRKSELIRNLQAVKMAMEVRNYD
jgi:DNA-binding MarR family transcriptional regulator